MSVSLSKGQGVSLQKRDGSQLSRVRMGLGWDPIKKRGMFGSREVEIDLDASAVLFADHQPVDVAFFNHLRSNDGSVAHTGDNRTGAGEGDDESIVVDLQSVPPNISQIVFVVNSFTGQNFSQIENAFCRLVDSTANDTEIARYELTGSGNHNSQVMAKVSRAGSGWTMTAIGAIANGRTFRDLLPTVTQHL